MAATQQLTPLDEFLLENQTWTLEVYLAMAAMVWGIWVLLPFETFDPRIGAYTVLRLAPEWAWGVVFSAHGLGHWVSITRKDPMACYRAALSGSVLWGIVLISFVIAAPLTTASPVYGLFVLASLWVAKSLNWRFG